MDQTKASEPIRGPDWYLPALEPYSSDEVSDYAAESRAAEERFEKHLDPARNMPFVRESYRETVCDFCEEGMMFAFLFRRDGYQALLWRHVDGGWTEGDWVPIPRYPMSEPDFHRRVNTPSHKSLRGALHPLEAAEPFEPLPKEPTLWEEFLATVRGPFPIPAAWTEPAARRLQLAFSLGFLAMFTLMLLRYVLFVPIAGRFAERPYVLWHYYFLEFKRAFTFGEVPVEIADREGFFVGTATMHFAFSCIAGAAVAWAASWIPETWFARKNTQGE